MNRPWSNSRDRHHQMASENGFGAFTGATAAEWEQTSVQRSSQQHQHQYQYEQREQHLPEAAAAEAPVSSFGSTWYTQPIGSAPMGPGSWHSHPPPPPPPQAQYMDGMPMSMPQFPRFPYPHPPLQPEAPCFEPQPPPLLSLSPTRYVPPTIQPTARSSISTRHASRSSPSVKPPPRPVAAAEYLEQSRLDPIPTSSPRPLLIILDLNGTLIYRKRRGYPVSFVKRPGLNEFLDTLFSIPEFKVMIWSSARPDTVAEILDRLLGHGHRRQLIATWARTTLDLSQQQYREKVQVFKRLDKVWNEPTIQAAYPRTNKNHKKKQNKYKSPFNNEHGKWDQTNTLLIDDSALKAISHPHNIIEIPEFTNDPEVDEAKNLHTVIRQLRLLRYQEDVSRKLRQWAEKRHEGSTTVSVEAVHGFWERELELEELAIAARKTLPSNKPALAPVTADGDSNDVETQATYNQGPAKIEVTQKDGVNNTEKDNDNAEDTAPQKRTRNQKRADRRRRQRQTGK